ncbi:S-methyl-5'-thioadenosine phosphorylase [Lapillicoccus jejuensis]|uniref:Purine nucleoside phosphorylase n=1 Tax=Lapillicoccus jejuensis TaxID=402171 RepID=A0A542E153_9MICO|nr:S-methyl-5'-thioadenosine phosphorylase [Lapillicoccus jejuensis]TQJ09080.1 5'-methylthioadenosine phosphorylase [Lapillicoccus jejuensis]
MTTTTPTARRVTGSEPLAEIGLIGGSGFYEFFTDAERVSVATPFGEPSDDVVVGEVDGRRVAFLARHGQGHRFPPHRVNYRANLWALRALGVRQVLAPCAVGSLRPELGPGTLVVPDQVVDRTWGRAHTVYDEPGPVVHVPFADPYCPRGRAAVVGAAEEAGLPHAADGTLVVVNGPRFSSRAESRWHQAAGWSVVGMTGMPEASVARELALCFTTVALVTDLDAGVEGDAGVTHAEVMEVFAANIERLKAVLRATVPRLPEAEDDAAATCGCRRVLDGLTLPVDLP